MRVLVVTQYFWPELFRVNDLATELARRGHEVEVLTGVPNYPARGLFPDHGLRGPWSEWMGRVRIRRVPLLPRGKGRGWRLALNYLSFVASACVVGPFRVGRSPQVIFVYEPSPITVGIPAVVLKRLTGAPIVFWVQDVWPDSLAATGAVRSPRLLAWASGLTRWVYSHCERVLAASAAFVPLIRAQGVEPARVGYLPNWAEGFYRPRTVALDAPERDHLPAGFKVLFAGNIGVSQSFGTILDAVELLRDGPEVQWVVIGEGRQRQWLEEEVARRGMAGNFHLLGPRPAETMPTYFALADVLLLALNRDPLYALTVPSKLQTYLACGRPVAAALEGEGARIVAESGAGLVAGADDPVALAGAVRALHDMSSEERAAMGRRGRRYYEQHFKRDRLLDEVEALLTAVVEEGAHRDLRRRVGQARVGESV